MQGPRRRQLLLSLALACACASGHAQTFPTRPVRIIVPQPPGGGFDTVGRLLADRLGRCRTTACATSKPSACS